MKLKQGLQLSSGDFYYDLAPDLGGYLKPEEMCENQEDAQRVIEAIKIVREFEKSCEEQIEDFVQ